MTPEEVTREVRRLEITTRHLVRDIVAGEYSSAFRGRGVEFAEVREYQPGDDIRTIDWNVTARLGSAFVKRYLEERELTVVFVVDRSASERFGSRVRTRGDLAAEVVAVLAFAAARNNDRVGAPPRDRPDRVVHPATQGPAARPPGHQRAAGLRARSVAAPTWARRSARSNPSLRRRAVIFLVSDFLTTGYESALARLARRHDLIAIQLVDPRERELPDVGLVTLLGPGEAETGV